MDADAVNKLEKKVTDEFWDLLCRVRKGYRPDLEFILEEISFIDLIKHNEFYEDEALTILSYYLNNKWIHS